ncbi:hypothetical protein pdam_00008452 [Pocillopora damicornis]|uniref:Uncharacterized protein n=1 Tax=Pocillopora damicornis TaxID=46731 RepID=A0A3M6TW78_POCDA|nr:uncharacterized protein NCBP2-AS2 homolog [Pocillopora damicornis]XP_058954804.1 protein NCBP2AS2 homolog [Pocillopora verrucosa]RMX45519.1 hypothetical protein pdam_00008452 [Pocillopora damicornis]
MPLRYLLSFLANEQVVERLANSYPIRRLAQLTHYTYRQVTLWGNDALDKAVKSREAPENVKKNSQMSNRVVSFSRNFFKNVQEEIDKIQQKPRQ